MPAKQLEADSAVHLALQERQAGECPSTYPLLHGSFNAAFTASRSRLRPTAKLSKFGQPMFRASSTHRPKKLAHLPVALQAFLPMHFTCYPVANTARERREYFWGAISRARIVRDLLQVSFELPLGELSEIL